MPTYTTCYVINPQPACAARVTVLGFVCLSVHPLRSRITLNDVSNKRLQCEMGSKNKKPLSALLKSLSVICSPRYRYRSACAKCQGGAGC